MYQTLDQRFILKQFGSSIFGAADKNSDIDILLISFNELLNREAFVVEFVDYLRSLSGSANVHAIPTAKIPIVKLEYLGVQLDIIYCAMISPFVRDQLKPVPFDYLLNIKNVSFDKSNTLSFSGWRTCQKLLEMKNASEMVRFLFNFS